MKNLLFFRPAQCFAALMFFLCLALPATAQWFPGGRSYATDNGPVGVKIADVNGDGRRDVVTCNYSTGTVGTVSVLLGLAGGGFGPKTDYQVYNNPRGLALGDLNGDGKADIVTANDNNNAEVSVLLALPAGGFAPRANYVGYHNSYDVALGDVDNDGDLDVLVTDYYKDVVSVRLNDGAGAFGAETEYATAPSPGGIAVADLNGDGRLDVVTANDDGTTATSAVSVLLGQAGGGFAAFARYSTGTRMGTIDVGIGDLTGDGRPDVVTANVDDNSVTVLPASGLPGRFGAAQRTATGRRPWAVAVGDLTGDGRPDVATANLDAQTASIFPTLATGLLGARTDYRTGREPFAIGLGDLNGDGKLDVATANPGGTNATVLLNQTAPPPAPTFTAFTPTAGPTGTSVTITGTNLAEATTVRFAGTANNDVLNGFTASADGTTLTGVVVPGGAITGQLSVVTPGGTATSALLTPASFTVQGFVVTATSQAPWSSTAPPATGTVGLTFSAAPQQSPGLSNVRVYRSQFKGRRSISGATVSGTNAVLTLNSSPSFRPGEMVQVTVPATVVSSTSAALRPYVYQFTTATTGGAGTFGASASFGTGLNPQRVALGDFNSDGLLDMAVANQSYTAPSSVVSVLLAQAGGGFAAKVDYAVANTPGAILVADANSDGFLDIITANRAVGVNSVSVLPGSSTAPGTFGARVNYGVNAQPLALAMGDINADGLLDIATVSAADNNVAVLLALSAGGYATRVNYALPIGAIPAHLALGDVTGDGRLDLVTANSGTHTLTVLPGTATGTFGAGTSYGTGLQPVAVVLADFDNDGRADLATANQTGNSVSVLRALAAGGFGARTDYPTAAGPLDLAAGDLNGDGRPDLVAGNGTGNTVSVLLAQRALPGTFGLNTDYAGPTPRHGLALGDADNDGRLDVATANGSAATASLLLGLAAPLPTLTSFAPVSGPVGTTLTINGTNLTNALLVSFGGVADNTVSAGYSVNAAGTQLTGVVVPAGAQTGPISVTTAGGTASSSALAPANFTLVEPLRVTARLPATHSATAAGSTAVAVTFDAAPTAASAVTIRIFGSQGRGLRGTGAATLNGTTATLAPTDGDFRAGETVRVSVPATVQTATGDAATPYVYQFTTAALAGQGFGAKTDYATGTGPYAVAAADCTGDGRPDIISTNFTANSVSVLAGRPDGTFSPKTDYAVGTQPYGLTVGDVNGDGRLDLAVANSGSNTVSVLLGLGSGGFGAKTDYPTGTSPRAVALGDVDGDGDLDLAVANGTASTASVLLNAGAGVFGLKTDYPAGTAPREVALADLNLDGKLDLLVLNATDATLSVLRGGGAGGFGPKTDYATGPTPRGMAVGDVTGDGRMDVVTASSTFDSVVLMPGLTSGGFGLSFNRVLNTAGFPLGVALGDLDGDGKMEIVATNATLNSVSVIGVQQFTNTRTDYPVGTGPRLAALADLNGDGRLDILTANFTSNDVSVLRAQVPPPTITSFAPVSGPVGSTITITGTNLSGATVVTFAGSSANTVTTGYAVNAAGTQITGIVVPGGAITGLLGVTTPGGTATTALLTPANFTLTVPDLVVSTGSLTVPTAIPAGTYNLITVTDTGHGLLTGATTTNAGLTVQTGGSLALACQPLTGPGSFTLAAGATLGICAPAGLSLSGATGEVQVSGLRTFSPDASYVYNGTQAQVTGAGLPAQVRALGTANALDLTLTRAVRVAQTLALGAAGNLDLNGQALTLLSSTTGTALVINASTGVVTGGTATVQRAIIGSSNPGLGYRHYASPVRGNTVADLATATFAPVFNSTYNASLVPGQVRPFPTVMAYDQSRLPMNIIDYTVFDRGWYSPASGPASTPEACVPGRGYAVNLGGGELVDFVGTLNTGDYALALARNSGPTAAEAGWAFVGNPYPAPIDWQRVLPAERPGLDASIYVCESSGQYTGSYRSYVNFIGDSLIASGQGFFVRVSQGQTTASLTFRNRHRLLDYAQPTTFRRGGADARPRLALALRPVGSPAADVTQVYFETGATAAFDPEYDAAKLPNTTGLNLASRLGGEEYAINGLPPLGAAPLVLPLAVRVPAAGRYELTVNELLHFAPGIALYLRDALANTLTPLTAATRYAFALAGTTAPGRFVIEFRPAGALATAAQVLEAQVQVWPNPATAGTGVMVAAPAGASVTLFDALGRALRPPVVVGAAGTVALPTGGLAAGVYVLRVHTAMGGTSRRLVVQ